MARRMSIPFVLWGYLQPYKFLLLLCFILLLLSTSMIVSFSLLIQALVSGYDVRLSAFVLSGSGLAATLISVTLLGMTLFFRAYLLRRLSGLIIADVRRDIFDRVLAREYRLSQHSIGQFTKAIMVDTAIIQSIVDVTFGRILHNALIVLGALGLMFYFDAALTCLILIILPGVCYLFSCNSLVLKRSSERLLAQEKLLSASLSEIFSGLYTLKMFGAESVVGQTFHQQIEQARQTLTSVARAQASAFALSTIAAYTVISLVIWYQVNGIAQATSDHGTLTGFTYLALILAVSLMNIGEESGALRHASSIFVTILSGSDKKAESKYFHADDNMASGTPAPAICLTDVSFCYRDKGSTFFIPFLSIEQGEKIAIVGSSGAGKSTLMNIIMGMLSVSTGRVSIFGQPISADSMSENIDKFSSLPSEPHIFTGSIKYNVKIANYRSSDQEIEQALTLARLDSLFGCLPDGYNTVIDQATMSLSFGQKQRLGLARVFLRNAPIVLLDEPATGLDTMNEMALLNTLDSHCADKTLLMVTHDIQHASLFPRILVMEEGRIVGDGCHDRLLTECEAYRMLQPSPLAKQPEQ